MFDPIKIIENLIGKGSKEQSQQLATHRDVVDEKGHIQVMGPIGSLSGNDPDNNLENLFLNSSREAGIWL